MTRDDVLERDAVLDERAFCLQQAFRALLDAMARPGEVAELPAATATAEADARAAGLFSATVTVADVLLDAATSVAVAGERGSDAERVLSRRAHVLSAAADDAPYAILPLDVDGAEACAFVSCLTSGTLVDPHLGATCVVECGTLLGTDAAGARTGSVSGAQHAGLWELSGPGIKDTARFACDRGEALQARIERADEFPCGIDLVLVDRASHVVAVPRSSALRPVSEDASEQRGENSWAM